MNATPDRLGNIDKPIPISADDINSALAELEDTMARLKWLTDAVDRVGLQLIDITQTLDGMHDPKPLNETVHAFRAGWIRETVRQAMIDKEAIAERRLQAVGAVRNAMEALGGYRRYAVAITCLRWDNEEDRRAFYDARPILAAMNPTGGSTESDVAAMCRRVIAESHPVDPTAGLEPTQIEEVA